MPHLPAAARRILDSDDVLRGRWTQLEHFWYVRDIKAYRRALPRLLTSSTKTEKGHKVGVLTGITYLAPATESGFNVCPMASAGCANACLGHSSGQMRFSTSKRARILRTWAFKLHREYFDIILARELEALEKRAARLGLRPFVRLNGTSDVLPSPLWAAFFPNIQFYDYTKLRRRALENARGLHPTNYHVTFSRNENNDQDCLEVLAAGGNVAMVFRGELPHAVWYDSTKGFRRHMNPAHGWPVVDGDKTDARPDDRCGVVVGLTTKGPLAKRDTSGFVIH